MKNVKLLLQAILDNNPDQIFEYQEEIDQIKSK